MYLTTFTDSCVMVSRFCWLSGHLESQSFQKKSRAVSGVGLEGELEQGCFGHVQRPPSETEESRKPALFPCCACLPCSYFLLSPHNWIAASHAACRTKSSVIECAFVFSISNHGFDNKINSPITVYVLQLRTFSWPTPYLG